MVDLRDRFNYKKSSQYLSDNIDRQKLSPIKRTEDFKSYNNQVDYHDKYYNKAQIDNFIASPIRERETARYPYVSDYNIRNNENYPSYQNQNINLESTSYNSPIKLVEREPVRNPSQLFKANDDSHTTKALDNSFNKVSTFKSHKWSFPILRSFFEGKQDKDQKSVSFEVDSRRTRPDPLENDRVDAAIEAKRKLQEKLEVERKIRLEQTLESMKQELEKQKLENNNNIHLLRQHYRREISQLEKELDTIRKENTLIKGKSFEQESGDRRLLEVTKNELKRKHSHLEETENNIMNKQRKLEATESSIRHRCHQLDQREDALNKREKAIILKENHLKSELARVQAREEVLEQKIRKIELRESSEKIRMAYYHETSKIRSQISQLEDEIVRFQNEYMDFGGTQYRLSNIQSKKKVYQKIDDMIVTAFVELKNSDFSKFIGYHEIHDDLKLRRKEMSIKKSQMLEELTDTDGNADRTRELYINLLLNLYELKELNGYLISFNELFEKGDLAQLSLENRVQ